MFRSELRLCSWRKSSAEESKVCEHFGGCFRSIRKKYQGVMTGKYI